MSRFVVAFFAVSLLIPTGAYADVLMSEIAWMGTHTSANHEWIELHNTGTASVVLDGWTLSALDGTPNIALSGTIAAGGYFLLERTSDDTVSGIPADLIYTGALGNSGEVLELRNAQGVLVDRVDSGENWSLGGDNTTKDTVQRIGSIWTTGVPTPRAPNSSVQSAPAQGATREGDASRHIMRTVERGNDTPHLRVADPLFRVSAGEEKQGIVGIPLTFSASAFSGMRELLGELFVWNMGDGTVLSGRHVTHSYRYPGTYMVSVEAHTTLFKEEKRAFDTVTVTIHESGITVGEHTRDFIELRNTTAVVADVSNMSLVVGSHTVRLPPQTYLPPQQSVRFLRSALAIPTEVHGAVLVLTDTGYVIARSDARETQPTLPPVFAATGETVARLAQLTTARPPAPLPSHGVSPDAALSLDADIYAPANPVDNIESVRNAHLQSAAGNVAAPSPTRTSLWVWVLALFGVVVSASALVLSRRPQELPVTAGATLSDADQFTIIEDDIDEDARLKT